MGGTLVPARRQKNSTTPSENLPFFGGFFPTGFPSYLHFAPIGRGLNVLRGARKPVTAPEIGAPKISNKSETPGSRLPGVSVLRAPVRHHNERKARVQHCT